MPTYEYKCKACNHQFDLVQRISDPAPTVCPECEGGPVQKVFTSVGIIFKGSGFHVNDYRKTEPKSDTAPADGEKAALKEDAKVESPGDTKPAGDAPKAETPAPKAEPAAAPSTPAKES